MDAIRLAKSQRRLNAILEDIDAEVGKTGALQIIEDADNFSVPRELREQIARTALYLLQEMSAESASAHHARLKKKHQDYKSSLPAGHEHKGISFNKWKKLDREGRGALGKGSPRKGNKKPFRRGVPSGARKGRAARSVPSAGGPQGGSGGKSAAPRKKAEKKAEKKAAMPLGLSPSDLKKRLDKPKDKGRPDAPYSRGEGKKFKRLLPPKVGRKRDDSSQIADLFQGRAAAGKTSTSGRSKTIPHPKPEPGRRFDPQHHWYDKDVEERWRRQSPEDHLRHMAARAGDLEDAAKEFERRGHVKGIAARAGKLARMIAKHPAHRHPNDPDKQRDLAKGHGGDRKRILDIRKGYDPDEGPHGQKKQQDSEKRGGQGAPSAAWKGHAKDPDTGEVTHSTGDKANKKFANATTFGNTDDDAMLHTDKDKSGARGTAKKDEFAIKGKKVDKDPRQKWFRVSRQGGYASAMGSLGAAYHGDEEVKGKVMDKVRSTGFTDDKGHQIHIRPTGGLHDERPECRKNPDGSLSARGQKLKDRDPEEFYRLCKGIHGPADPGERKAASAARNEYQKGFDPQHDSPQKIKALHKAAEAGKASLPTKKIKAREAARTARRG